MVKKKTIIIGSGLGGLATACLLGKAGYKVDVFEKNDQLGGRAGIFKEKGFTFDMGPSWYLMPDIFEQFFTLLDEDINQYLKLKKLSPSYRIYFKDEEKKPFDFFSDLQKDLDLFEKLEKGSSKKFQKYLEESEKQYLIARDRFIYKNYQSIFDFLTPELIINGTKLSVFSKMNHYVSKYFSSEKIKKVLQYPLVFLGSSPYNTPALYNIMTHIDFNMGVFYPMGGIYEIVKALKSIAEKYDVKFHLNQEVEKIITEGKEAKAIQLQNGTIKKADLIISNADPHFTETTLLQQKDQMYSQKYWKKCTLSPSAFILYLGMKKTIPNLKHHTLIFSKDWEKNFGEIFDSPQWPEDPSLYICSASKTDPSVAPKGKENIFILVPIAPDLEESEETLDKFEKNILKTIAKVIDYPNFEKEIIFKKRFTGKNFLDRYNSFKGSALGLAHTMNQTAIFRPKNKHKKVKNLFYVGGNVNPGIGMPMCLVSAQLVYKHLTNDKSSGPLTEIKPIQK